MRVKQASTGHHAFGFILRPLKPLSTHHHKNSFHVAQAVSLRHIRLKSALIFQRRQHAVSFQVSNRRNGAAVMIHCRAVFLEPSFRSIRPAGQYRADRVARADRGIDHQFAFLQTTIVNRIAGR